MAHGSINGFLPHDQGKGGLARNQETKSKKRTPDSLPISPCDASGRAGGVVVALALINASESVSVPPASAAPTAHRSTNGSGDRNQTE